MLESNLLDNKMLRAVLGVFMLAVVTTFTNIKVALFVLGLYVILKAGRSLFTLLTKSDENFSQSEVGVLFDKRYASKKECKKFADFLLDEIDFMIDIAEIDCNKKIKDGNLITPQERQQIAWKYTELLDKIRGIEIQIRSIDGLFKECNHESVYRAIASILRVHAPKMASLSEIYHLEKGLSLFIDDKKGYEKALSLYMLVSNDLSKVISQFKEIQDEGDYLERLERERLEYLKKEETKEIISKKIDFL